MTGIFFPRIRTRACHQTGTLPPARRTGNDPHSGICRYGANFPLSVRRKHSPRLRILCRACRSAELGYHGCGRRSLPHGQATVDYAVQSLLPIIKRYKLPAPLMLPLQNAGIGFERHTGGMNIELRFRKPYQVYAVSRMHGVRFRILWSRSDLFRQILLWLASVLASYDKKPHPTGVNTPTKLRHQ